MHRRRQIQAVSTPTQWEAVELLRNNGFTVDQARLDRVFNDPHAQPVHGNVSITMVGNDILGLVKGTYHAKIVVAPQWIATVIVPTGCSRAARPTSCRASTSWA